MGFVRYHYRTENTALDLRDSATKHLQNGIPNPISQDKHISLFKNHSIIKEKEHVNVEPLISATSQCVYKPVPTFPQSHEERKNYTAFTYAEALAMRAINNTVMIALVDSGCLPIAFNFWITSLYPFNIYNYLFLTSDTE